MHNTFMCKHALASSALAIFGGLALACGGGGSGSGSGGADAEITAANAEEIASDVLQAIFLSADLSTFTGEIPGILPAGATATGEDARFRGLAAALRAAALDVEPLPSLPGGVAASQVIGPITESCSGGGTRTLTADIDGPQPSPGDRLEASFAACEEPLGSPELNGRFAYTITGLNGDLESLFSIALALTLDEFEEGTDGLDGNANTFFNNTTPPLVVSTAQGPSLRLTDATDRTLSLRGYQALLSQDLQETDYSIEANGEVSSSVPEGSPPPGYTGRVIYDTGQNLAADAGQMPSEGVVDVLGLNDSALRIVPVTGFNVDFGTAFAPPPRSFGAASGQVGRWTNVGLGETTLPALIGGDSQVRLNLSAATASGASSSPTDDAERLLNDHFSSAVGAPWTVTLSGLTQGSYRVFLYAPSDSTVGSGAMTVNGVINAGTIPGDPGGSLIENTSWVSVVVPVSGGTLVITGSDASTSGLAGLQIVPVVDEVVNLEIDADGDGEFEQTIPTNWTDLEP